MTDWPLPRYSPSTGSRALDEAIVKIEAMVERQAAERRAMLADAAARKARGEPPKVVRLAYDPHAGPNLAVGAPRFR